jgi:hypothetical protein
MTYIREDQADIAISVDGRAYGDGNSWATYTGGALTAADAKTRAGGMGKEINLGGPAARGDATLTIQNSDVMVGQHPQLEDRVGKGRAVISIQYLDIEGVAIPGASFRVTGRIKEAHLPDYNFDSGTQGMYTVVVGCDEVRA